MRGTTDPDPQIGAQRMADTMELQKKNKLDEDQENNLFEGQIVA